MTRQQFEEDNDVEVEWDLAFSWLEDRLKAEAERKQ